jgi:hypothetical protein
MLRAFVLALALMAPAPAFALDRNDVVGEWETQWANASGEAPDGGGPMRISADSNEESLDGVTPAPGFDGVLNGEITQQDGALVWTGRWASVWPEGTTLGTFRMVFSDADHFTGTWSTDDGVVAGAAWNGWRAR